MSALPPPPQMHDRHTADLLNSIRMIVREEIARAMRQYAESSPSNARLPSPIGRPQNPQRPK